jgi:hypothetical protein
MKSARRTLPSARMPWSRSRRRALDGLCASQGRVAVFLQLGDGAGRCADAPAKASLAVPNPNDRVDRFKAERKTPAPAICPAVP